MNSRYWLISAAVLVSAFQPVTAQSGENATLKPAVRLTPAREIELARTAAPSLISNRASIWVLGAGGYEQAVTGSNGFGCLVQRGTNGQSLIPRCDDAHGVSALYPVMFLLEEMRASGATVSAYTTAVGEGYRTGRFQAPQQGGLSYMYSVEGYFVSDTDQRVSFSPHVMIYWPNCAWRDLGVSNVDEARKTHLTLLGVGTPDCHLIINTPPETARKVNTDR